MKLFSKAKHRRIGGRAAAVGLMLSLWLGLWALEVSPDLHRFVHKDAGNPAHQCLVTQFQHHMVLAGFAATLVLAAPTGWSFAALPSDFQFCGSFDYRLSPSRAPPLA